MEFPGLTVQEWLSSMSKKPLSSDQPLSLRLNEESNSNFSEGSFELLKDNKIILKSSEGKKIQILETAFSVQVAQNCHVPLQNVNYC